MLNPSTVDDVMRAFISQLSRNDGSDPIEHFEVSLSRRWGIDRIFRLSNGVLVIDDCAFAEARMMESARVGHAAGAR
jgi:hypothetical protein